MANNFWGEDTLEDISSNANISAQNTKNKSDFWGDDTLEDIQPNQPQGNHVVTQNAQQKNNITSVQQEPAYELETHAQRAEKPLNSTWDNIKSKYHSGFQKFQEGYQNVGRNIPKLGQWWFGSKDEARFLKEHNDFDTPTIEESEEQYKNGLIDLEQFKKQVDIRPTSNLKHKAIIATMYSSGLRVSEAVHLHYDDISRRNMTIHVRETKGRIDRYTILSRKNLDLLTEYWFQCGRPKDILFPSSWTGDYLDIASVNQFFKASAGKAGITRRVSSHACRHSFASHLFESGVDIKYIQSLLGHVDPRSTNVYLHVSNKTLLGIRSPFDAPRGGGA